MVFLYNVSMRKNKIIFFEGLGLVDGHFSGIGQYILGILRGLDAVSEKELLAGRNTPKIKVIIPYDTIDRFNSFNFKHIEAKKIPISFKYMSALWHRSKLPPLDLFCGKGTYVFTRFVTMPLLFSESSVIIYDLSFELYKQFSDDKNALFLSKGTRKSIKQASRVFTISESVKKEITKFYLLPPDKIYVATPAADQSYFYRRSEQEIERVKVKYGIKGNYILSLSTLEPRKNLDTLVDSYCSLPAKIRGETGLLLVGVTGWKTDILFDKILGLVKQGFNISRPSRYVSDKDKPAIISGASILVYPSYYEGFGMPPLEALACGVPTITSRNSSLPEVVGDAGTLLEDCSNVEELSIKIESTLKEIKNKTKTANTKGPDRAEKFSWEKSAYVYWRSLTNKEGER